MNEWMNEWMKLYTASLCTCYEHYYNMKYFGQSITT